jgi:hypothetical protein
VEGVGAGVAVGDVEGVEAAFRGAGVAAEGEVGATLLTVMALVPALAWAPSSSVTSTLMVGVVLPSA